MDSIEVAVRYRFWVNDYSLYISKNQATQLMFKATGFGMFAFMSRATNIVTVMIEANTKTDYQSLRNVLSHVQTITKGKKP